MSLCVLERRTGNLVVGNHRHLQGGLGLQEEQVLLVEQGRYFLVVPEEKNNLYYQSTPLTQYLVIRLILVVFLLIVLLLVVLLILSLFCLLLLLLLAEFLILRFGLGNVVVFAASTGGHGDVLLDFNQCCAISLRYEKLA